MTRRRLFWNLFPTYMITIVLCVGGVGGYALYALRMHYRAHVAQDLKARALLIAPEVMPLMRSGNEHDLNAFIQRMGAATHTRFTTILPSGKVIADSEEDPKLMESHHDRPEVIAARREGLGCAIRYSETRKMHMLYVAMPLRDEMTEYGVLRAALPLKDIADALRTIFDRILLGSAILAMLAVGWGILASRVIARPLKEMTDGAKRFAAGDLSHRIAIPNTAELAVLAETLNQMAAQIAQEMHTISQQTSRLEAVLSSMNEGVIAVDISERIMVLNDVAAEILALREHGIRREQALGRFMEEIVREPVFQQLIRGTISGEKGGEAEIALHGESERRVRARCTALKESNGTQIGALMVLNDVTQIYRLENIRRDFVANVSHELKTPITSIQGFVETLREGAIEDKEKAAHFLEIIAKQVERLGAIIEDLLTLSRLDREEAPLLLERTETRVKEILEAAAEDCRERAAAAGMKIEIACPDELTAMVNPRLVKQAVVNLLDNAIRHSYSKTPIEVKGAVENSGVVISVQDHGCGIPPEHLPRLFERFYRVDKGRSRSQGGTGLGLAIVKHIAQAHGGNVSVESVVAKGSIFRIHLPPS